MAKHVIGLLLAAIAIRYLDARRPQISFEELFQEVEDVPPPTAPDEQDGGARSPGLSCYLNRDCQSIEFCVKPDRNTFSLGVCTPLPEFVPSRSEDHSRDLHFVVRNVRQLNEPSASRCKRQGRVEQRAHRGLQPSFDITAYLYNTYIENQRRQSKISSKTDYMKNNHNKTGASGIQSNISFNKTVHKSITDLNADILVYPTTNNRHRPGQDPIFQHNNRSLEVEEVIDDDMARGPLRKTMTGSLKNPSEQDSNK